MRTPARRRRNCQGCGHDLRKIAPPAGRTGRCVVLFVAGTTCIFPFSPLLSMTFPLRPPGGGKGPVMGALPPFEAPFQTPESPPVPRAEALCSLPACSNKSFAFGTGGRTHPSPYAGRHEVRTRELPFRAYPVPPSEGLPGCGHDLRTPKPLAGPYGGKGVSMTWGLGVTLHAIPCRQVRVFRKRSFCWNTRTPGGRGDVRL